MGVMYCDCNHYTITMIMGCPIVLTLHLLLTLLIYWRESGQFSNLQHSVADLQYTSQLTYSTRPISQYGAREYTEVERVQHKDLIDDRVEKLMVFSYGQPKGKNTD